ncbi:hypothetical protein B1F79_04345 [Coxiella-like endosymbiont of Rhipicephalus sanguineus]|uniref:hypothetical protein n=1 Tax=Coxiella-like endosymbiont of Rhipicephalus sanguineus TaxID=1955402 RepID=UPI0020420475|nr:hypothetical protein [Coxiella-like endosymbiont of Rhipicephalus sanguineus]MBT8506699.1 hypothetical protein [Coxiella-like endosymbiont of Rhipicephalus sanguineus]
MVAAASSGVERGTSSYAGLNQAWVGPSHFPARYLNNQDGMLPYKYINAILQSGEGYQNYNITQGNKIIASYVYSPIAKQFVGYESLDELKLKSLCQLIHTQHLRGAILWDGAHLVSAYRGVC